MQNEEAEEHGELNREWVNHPITRQLIHEYQKDTSRRLQSLLNACKNSTDPHVVKVAYEYERPVVFTKLLMEGKANVG